MQSLPPRRAADGRRGRVDPAGGASAGGAAAQDFVPGSLASRQAARLGRSSLHAWRRIRRAARRRLRAVDAPRPRAVSAPSLPGGVAGGDHEIGYEIADDPMLPPHRAARPGARRSRLRAFRPSRGRAAWNPGGLTGTASSPAEASAAIGRALTAPAAGRARLDAAFRLRLLRQLRAGLLLRLSPSGGGSAGPGSVPRRLHLRTVDPSPAAGPAPQRRQAEPPTSRSIATAMRNTGLDPDLQACMRR